MKKIIIKMVVVCIIILFFPFVLTLLLSDDSRQEPIHHFNFELYYEKDGKEEDLEFDQYLIGVIAANMPAGYHVEALKAQALIVRTYALYNISLLSAEEPDKIRFSTSELGLPYIGLEDMERYFGSDDYLSYFTKIENAVYGTNDEVIVYNNTLILPMFFDTGSGFTRNASEAWGVDIPYLVSVESKPDVTSMNYLRITEYSVPDLIEILNQNYDNLKLSNENFFDEVEVESRDSINYVTKINLGTRSVSGEEFAKVLGLNSNLFYIENFENKVRIICTGVGHGLGLSQYGANAMADEGFSYQDIIKHYYTGASITKIKEGN